MSKTDISFVYVQYLDDDSTEIVPTKRIKKWSCKTKEEFKKKFSVLPVFYVDWWDKEEKAWFEVEAVVHFVGGKQLLLDFTYFICRFRIGIFL